MELNKVLLDEFENKDAIIVRNLKVWTPEEKSIWRKVAKPKTVIIDNVSACIREGEFAAIIGPSGAGKTTFLVSLAGKCTLPFEGTVTINGRNVRDLTGAEIVPQFDVFTDSLTVMEQLVFMTEMKLGNSTKQPNKSILNTVIEEFKLSAHVETRIGSLSGGERRLLSLATSFLSNPQILICDEPTTGLDSYNASQVIGILKKLSASGKIVICSVHQPSCDIFKEFNSILLMAEGNLLFHGTQDACKSFFESIDLHCPLNYNPAEFYIRAVSNHNGVCIKKMLENYQDQSLDCDETGLEVNLIYKKPQRNWLKQVQLLLWRSSLSLKSDLKSYVFQLLLSVVVTASVLGTVYSGVTGTTQRGIQDVRGFLWLVTSEVCYGLAYSTLYVFKYEVTLFRREVGMYKCSAYFVSKFLSFIPRCVIWPIALVCTTTVAIELPNHVITTMEFIVVLIFAAIASMAYGLGMSALFTSTGNMGDVMPCFDLPLFLMSGAFLTISTLPIWLYPVKFISHFYYAMDTISNLYWRQILYIDCPVNTTTTCTSSGEAVLYEIGYSNNFVLQNSLGLLLVTTMWGLLGYYGMKREEKKGYAY